MTPGRSAMSDLDFRLRGKIAVRTDQGAFSASFDWRQARRRYAIDLWGPLGQGHVRLRGEGSTLSVTDRHGETLHSANAIGLMEDALGWSVPITALRHWVRGRYDPSTPARPATEENHAEDGQHEFEQMGWSVRALRWRDTAIGPAPGKVIAVQNGRRIVLVCRAWSLD